MYRAADPRHQTTRCPNTDGPSRGDPVYRSQPRLPDWLPNNAYASTTGSSSAVRPETPRPILNRIRDGIAWKGALRCCLARPARNRGAIRSAQPRPTSNRHSENSKTTQPSTLNPALPPAPIGTAPFRFPPRETEERKGRRNSSGRINLRKNAHDDNRHSSRSG